MSSANIQAILDTEPCDPGPYIRNGFNYSNNSIM